MDEEKEERRDAIFHHASRYTNLNYGLKYLAQQLGRDPTSEEETQLAELWIQEDIERKAEKEWREQTSIDEQNKIIHYKKMVQNGGVDIHDLSEDIRRKVVEAIEEERRQMGEEPVSQFDWGKARKTMEKQIS